MSAFQLTVPVFLIFQYLINFVPGRSRVPSGRFSSKNAAIMAGTTRGQGRFGRLHRKSLSCQDTLPHSEDFLRTSIHAMFLFLHFKLFSQPVSLVHLLRAVVLGGTRLKENRGGASVSVGGAPLYAPPLHPQLLSDFLDFGL